MGDVWAFDPAVRDGMTRYARVIAKVLQNADITPKPVPTEATLVESGVVLAKAMISGMRQTMPPLRGGRVVDRLAHERPLYRPVLAYALGLATGQTPAMLDDFAPEWDGATDAAAGDRVAAAAWAALAGVAVWGKPLDAGPLAVMGRLAEAQQASGAFLAARSSDNLEALWFHELAILHAVASFAVQVRQAWLWPAVARAVRYHVQETQPDHATNQPWGLTAFLLEPAGWPIADSMLHAASAHAAVEQDASPGLTLMLLADALYCLRQRGITE